LVAGHESRRGRNPQTIETKHKHRTFQPLPCTGPLPSAMLERDRTEREATPEHAGRGNGVEMMAG